MLIDHGTCAERWNSDSKNDTWNLEVKLRDLLEKGEYKGTVCRDIYSLSKPQLVKPLCLYLYATQLPIKVIIVSDVFIK